MGAVNSTADYRTDPAISYGYGGYGGSTNSSGLQGKSGIITVLGEIKSS